ncbi:MAG TPA: hypothetical protein PLC59_06480 [Bacteroidales bacterium]|jgi:hypothetical protein|nr:hypothetical protein [Bacteroidales bacterium]HQI45681.1 hypothetical protein [Bacteroidales bacterium]
MSPTNNKKIEDDDEGILDIAKMAQEFQTKTCPRKYKDKLIANANSIKAYIKWKSLKKEEALKRHGFKKIWNKYNKS